MIFDSSGFINLERPNRSRLVAGRPDCFVTLTGGKNNNINKDNRCRVVVVVVFVFFGFVTWPKGKNWRFPAIEALLATFLVIDNYDPKWPF
jgi:hypothetical protein